MSLTFEWPTNAWAGTTVACLRALGLPVRGLYTTKDSYVSLAMSRGVDPVWLQEQAGSPVTTKSRCEEGDLNPHGFYPTSPSN